MLRCYQPLMPGTNRLLQQRWDQNQYQRHRSKVSSALPVVDTRGSRTPAHIQLKLKKLQLQDERRSIIDRDNQLLASRLASISCSRGLVDHHNQYQPRRSHGSQRSHRSSLSDKEQYECCHGYLKQRQTRLLFSLNADRRREELLLVSRQNQAIYQRIRSRPSEYRRQLWLDDWEKAEQRRDHITRFPRAADDKRRSHRKVKFATLEANGQSESSNNDRQQAAGGASRTVCCRNRK